MKINLFVSDVIVLLMDQVSYTKGYLKMKHLILTIIMSKALMFLGVELKKMNSIYVLEI